MSYRSGSNSGNIGLAGAALLVTITGCQSYSVLPVTPTTDGSYDKLPSTSTKAAVWGTSSEAVQSVTIWLSKRGIILIDDVKIDQVASEIRVRPPRPYSNADVFKLGKIAGAKQVIFIDAEVTTWRISEIESFFGQQTAYTASVFIRALDTETGEIHWNGKALSRDKFTNLREGIDQLTCHALATAWGLRQPGTTAVPTICSPGQSMMVATEPPSVPTSTPKASSSEEKGPIH